MYALRRTTRIQHFQLFNKLSLNNFNSAYVYLNKIDNTTYDPPSQIWVNDIKYSRWNNMVTIRPHLVNKLTKLPHGVIYNNHDFRIYRELEEFKNAMDSLLH
jgi:hypothetical protein